MRTLGNTVIKILRCDWALRTVGASFRLALTDRRTGAGDFRMSCGKAAHVSRQSMYIISILTHKSMTVSIFLIGAQCFLNRCSNETSWKHGFGKPSGEIGHTEDFWCKPPTVTSNSLTCAKQRIPQKNSMGECSKLVPPLVH